MLSEVVLDNWPDIIEAVKTPLGLAALAFLIAGSAAFYFLKNASAVWRAIVVLIVLVGSGWIGALAIHSYNSSQSNSTTLASDAEPFTLQCIWFRPDTVELLIPGKEQRDTLFGDVSKLLGRGETLTIEGLVSDPTMSRPDKLGLGERRAEVVKDYLVSGGIDPVRIRTISYGKEKPVRAFVEVEKVCGAEIVGSGIP